MNLEATLPLPNQRDPAERSTSQFALVVAFILTVVFFAAGLIVPHFSPDCWSYLELSGTVFGDFYRYSTQRQFEVHSAYSNSFPPLWPVLIALARGICDLGIYTAVALNFAVCLGLLCSLNRFSRRMGAPGWIGSVAFLGLFSFNGFLDEALAGRSIPLSLWLFTEILIVLIAAEVSRRDAILAGVLMGLNCLTRFDMLPVAVLSGGILAFRRWRHDRSLGAGVAIALLYFAAFVLILSPWIGFSWTHFHKPLASDNTRQVLMARPGHVSEYYERPAPVDLFQNPREWAIGLVKQKARNVIQGAILGFPRSFVPILLLCVFAGWIALARPSLNGAARRFFVIGMLLIPFSMISAILVGYGDPRYWSAPFLIVSVILLGMLSSMAPASWSKSRILVLLLLAAAWPLFRDVARPAWRIGPANWTITEAIGASPEMRQLADDVKQDANGQPHRLLDPDPQRAMKFGALTGEPTSMMPTIVNGSFASFVRDWGITHIYDPDGEFTKMNRRGVEMIPLEHPGLFRLRHVESNEMSD